MQLTHKIKVAVVASVAALAFAGAASPAFAAPGDTTTTFVLSGGALSITVPTSQALGTVATGSSTTAAVQLGSITATDARGALLGTWSVGVTSTAFTTGSASADETIANSNAGYWSGAATASTGTGVFLPGQLLVANKQTLAASRVAFSASAVIGNNTASWNPTVNVNIPSASVAGSYSGTITHSFA